MQTLAIIAVFLLAGMLCRRFFDLPAQTVPRLNQFVIYLCLPAVVLLKIPELEISPAILYPMLSCWLMIALSAIACIIGCRVFGYSRDVLGCLLMVATLGNTSFLGFPAITLLLGSEHLAYAILFDQLGNFIALAIYGSFVIAWFGHNDERFSLPKVSLKVVSFPPFVALMLGLALPQPVSNYSPLAAEAFSLLGLLLVPMAMFIVGLQLRFKLSPSVRGPLLLGLGVKMVFAPMILLALGFTGLASPAMAITSVLEAGMPSMVTAGVMAMVAGLAPELAVAMVGLGLLLAAVTLPLWMLISQYFFL